VRRRVGIASALASGLLGLVTLGASSAPPVPLLPTPPGAASIYYPGSGDYAGFRIVVEPGGRAIAIDGAGHAATQLASGVSQKFFADLTAVGPLDRIAPGPCADTDNPSGATVELSTPLIITWKGHTSPQLACAKDAPTQRLLLDAVGIQQALYVQAYRKRNLITYGTARSSGYGELQYSGAAPSAIYSASATAYGVSTTPMTFDQFYAGGLRDQAFYAGPFTMDHFSNGLQFTSPFVGTPFTGTPYTALPAASLPTTSPYTSLPYGSPFIGTPYGSSPFTGSPFSGLTTTSPYSGSPFSGPP
jgi:hypothetical protein